MNDERRYERISRGALYGLIIAYAVCIIMAVISIQYANYIDRRSNQRWCSLFVVLDEAYKQTPPSNPTGRRVADEIHRLRIEFEC